MTVPTIYDVTAYASATNQSSWGFNITIPSLTDGMLLVCLHLNDTAENDMISYNEIRWGGSGGTLLTEIVEAETQGNSRTNSTGWFYLLNPTATTQQIYWANSSVSVARQALTVYLLENVKQTSPINASNGAGDGGSVVSELTATITGTSTNSLTLYGWTNRNGTKTITVTGATERSEVSTGTNTTVDLVATTATETGASGSQDATATWGGSERASWVAVQIEGVASGSTYNLLANIVAGSTTPTIANSVSRNLLGSGIASSTTPAVSAVILRELLGSVLSVSNALGSLGVGRNLLSVLQGLSSASDTVSAGVSRSLSGQLSASSQTPTITLSIETLISLLASVSASSQTGAISADVLRGLVSSSVASSQTGAVVLNLENLISLLASVSASSQTGGVLAGILRSVFGSGSADSQTNAVALDVVRLLVSDVSAGSQTSAISANLAKELVSSLSGNSQTSAITVLLSAIVSLLASIQAESSSQAASVDVSRNLSGSASADSIANGSLNISRPLVGSLGGVSQTDLIALQIARSLGSGIVSESVSSSITLDVARFLVSAVNGTSQVSEPTLLILTEIVLSALIAATSQTLAVSMDLEQVFGQVLTTLIEMAINPKTELETAIDVETKNVLAMILEGNIKL